MTEARQLAYEAQKKAEESWKHPTRRPQWQYKEGDQVWLEGINIRTYHPMAKLAPKRHGPFQITKVLGPVTYQLRLLDQWQIHPVFHVDLLTPYKETVTYGQNYTRPPPDLINGEEEYEVERVINSRRFGRGRQVQYLVKWKGYPDLDNQWIKWQDVNAPNLIAEYQRENPDAITHIRRGWNHDESIPIPSSSSLSAITDLLTPHLSSMSNALPTSAFLGSTMQAQGCHLTLYETAAVQVDDPTDGTAIIQRVMDLTQNPTTSGITEDGQGTSDDFGRDVGADTDANSEFNRNKTSLVGTNSQARICHATSATTTKGPNTRGDTMPIDIDALEPGSPGSPIYVDALEYPPSPKPQRSDSPDIPVGPITHTQLRLSVSKGNETPFCCHADGTPIQPHEVGSRRRNVSNILTSDVPPGFVRNNGLNFVPFPITNTDGITQHPDYIHIVMIDDPFILAVIRGNPHVYGQALHITPRISDHRHPRYDPSDLVIFRARHDCRNTIDDVVQSLGDKSVTAEVHRWCNLMI